MADNTTIGWANENWDPVTGCLQVSPGCKNCHAMRLAGARRQQHPSRAGLTRPSYTGPVWTGEVRLNEDWLAQPRRWRRPRRVFVCAHGDLFAESVPDEWIELVFSVMASAMMMEQRHTFLVLTKRPSRMVRYLTNWAADGRPLRMEAPLWPGLWLGVSVEDQQRADERRAALFELANRGWNTFVSYEPALGPVDWNGWGFLKWLVSGGESGPKARSNHPNWHRAARDFAADKRIPYYFNGWGEWAGGDVRAGTGLPFVRQFSSFQHWVDKAPYWINGGTCIDTAGNILRRRQDFIEADANNLFPVAVMHRVGKRCKERWLDDVQHNDWPEMARC